MFMTHEHIRNASEAKSIETFVRYTHPSCGDIHEHQFPSSFDLSFLRPHIDELYNFAPVNVDAEYVVQSGDRHDSANIERGSYLYLDQTDGGIKTTEIMSGTYDSLSLDFTTYYHRGGLRLMTIHTHPDEILFSPVDYGSILNGNSKAALVLCPTSQALVLATSATPKLDMSRAQELTEQWTSIFHQRMEMVNSEESRIRQNLAALSMDKPLIRIARDRLYKDEFARLSNQTLVEINRAINVKMYFSTNRQDFYEAY